jgi:anti-sigma factor RsiW
MDCRKARAAFEELLSGERELERAPELQEHLEQCPECQEWYAGQTRVIEVLEQLETFPAPEDFAGRVLYRLPDSVPQQQPGLAGKLRERWETLLAGLARPAFRRRLVPALTIAAALLLVLGVLYVWQGGEVTTTPGAAVGWSPWFVAGGLFLVAFVVVAVLILSRRKR